MVKKGLGPITLMTMCRMTITLITLIIRVIGACWLLYGTRDRTKGKTKEAAMGAAHGAGVRTGLGKGPGTGLGKRDVKRTRGRSMRKGWGKD